MDVLTDAVGAEDLEEVFSGVDGVLGGVRETKKFPGRGVNYDVNELIAVLIGWKRSESVGG